MPSFFTQLLEPVKVITKGGGVHAFDDTRQLFAWLEGIPSRRDSILSIHWGRRAISEDDVAGLETMLWLVGWETFKRASKRAGTPYHRFGTRYSWQFLAIHLGWDWRARE